MNIHAKYILKSKQLHTTVSLFVHIIFFKLLKKKMEKVRE